MELNLSALIHHLSDEFRCFFQTGENFVSVVNLKGTNESEQTERRDEIRYRFGLVRRFVDALGAPEQVRTQQKSSNLIRPFDQTCRRLGQRLTQSRMVIFAKTTNFLQCADEQRQRGALRSGVAALFLVERVSLATTRGSLLLQRKYRFTWEKNS